MGIISVTSCIRPLAGPETLEATAKSLAWKSTDSLPIKKLYLTQVDLSLTTPFNIVAPAPAPDFIRWANDINWEVFWARIKASRISPEVWQQIFPILPVAAPAPA